MTERASIFETIQIGAETTPGTAVAALKRLQGLTVEPGIKSEVDTYRPTGVKFPTVSAQAKEWVEATLGGPLTYTDIVYLLSSVIKTVTPSAAGAVYTWLFSPDSNSPDTAKTYTIEQGSSLRAHRFAYGLVTGLTLNFSRDECTVDGSMIGQNLTDDVYLSSNAIYTIAKTGTVTGGTFTLTKGALPTTGIAYDASAAVVQAALEALAAVGTGNVICTGGPLPATPVVVEFVGSFLQTAVTMTLDTTSITGGGSLGVIATLVGAAPTDVALVPVTPTQVLVYTATTQAGLAGASALTRNFSASWAITNRFGPVWVLNGVKTFAAHVEVEPTLEMKILVEADDAGMAYLGDLQDGDTLWVRIKATGGIADGVTPYSLTIDTATKVTDISSFQDQDGVFAVEYTLTGVHDATWGKATEITVVNKITSL